MAVRDARQRVHVDPDGVRTIDGGGVRLGVWALAGGFALIALLLWVAVGSGPRLASPPADPSTAEPGHPSLRPTAQRPGGPAPQIPGRREMSHPGAPELRPGARALPGLTGADPVPEEDDADASADAEEPSGIALFPPAGTNPIQSGIIVPDDFELPPGYVRHYQTTDGGQQLPPILMFHPDYHPLDATGAPVPIPESRVVPPELALPGLPIELLEVPADKIPSIDLRDPDAPTVSGADARARAGGRESRVEDRE